MKINLNKKIIVIEKGRTIHMIPVGSIKEAKGIAKGVSTDDLRDEAESFD